MVVNERLKPVLVIVAPGQGSQTPGFLLPWLEVPGFEDRLSWLSAVSGVDLVAHGCTSDADTIRDTAIAQPLIVGAGLVTLLSLFPHPSAGFSAIALTTIALSAGDTPGFASAGDLNSPRFTLPMNSSIVLPLNGN